ncbi:unnamed protein product [Sphagnum troendelagicum]|jgi:hypothetical protein
MAITAIVLAGLWRKPTAFSDTTVLSPPVHKARHIHHSSFIARGAAGVKDVVASSSSSSSAAAASSSSSSSTSHGWQKRKGRRRRVSQKRLQSKRSMDPEFDLVIVPADGISMSGSDSEDSDWSVGWFEPHHSDFTDNELEDSFAVLVPCYGSPARSPVVGSDQEAPQNAEPAWATILANLARQTNEEHKKHLERWLACL